MLSKFSEALRGNLTKLQRLKVVALVTIEVSRKTQLFVDAVFATADLIASVTQVFIFFYFILSS